MAIVSVAIVLSFHLNHKASDTELRMAKPLGTVFWLLSVACLGLGIANYTRMRRLSHMLNPWKLSGSAFTDGTNFRDRDR